ncbi:MAG: tail fiber domain-containing protein [Arcticibacter sp.]
MKIRLMSLMLMVIGFSGANAQTWNLAGNAGTDPTTMFIGTTDSKALRFRTNNGVRMHISSFGKIGIGTTSPIFKMDLVGGSYNTDSLYRIKGVAVLSRDNTNRIQLGDATARVGIGTATPANTLQVVGDASFSQDINVNGITIGKGGGSNTSNTASGYQALKNNTTGENNSANGFMSLSLSEFGNRHSAFGCYSMGSTIGGLDHTAVGYAALYSMAYGFENSAFGSNSMFNLFDGYGNTACGAYSLDNTGISIGNTALGTRSGYFYSNGNYNTFIGYESYCVDNGYSNSTGLGNATIIDASNKVRIGNTSITSIGGQVAWTTFSDGRYKRNVEEDVPGLEFITKLRPVTYTSDITGLNKHYPKPALREGQRQAPEQDVTSQEAIRYSGFIAQEVETAAKEIGYDFSGVDKPQREGNLYGLRYSDFVVPMVKAIQELSKENQDLKERLQALEAAKNNTGSIKIGITDTRDEILLGQNIPNPADNSTIIPFSIPTNCKSASILIADHARGRAIKAVPLSCKDTHLMLDAGSLASGTYSYSLFVDGVNIDTKQMVIVK